MPFLFLFFRTLRSQWVETRTGRLLGDGKLHEVETSYPLFQRWSPLEWTSYEWSHPNSSAPDELPSDPRDLSSRQRPEELPSLLKESWANKMPIILSYLVCVTVTLPWFFWLGLYPGQDTRLVNKGLGWTDALPKREVSWSESGKINEDWFREPKWSENELNGFLERNAKLEGKTSHMGIKIMKLNTW